jgi:hypothetical protein
LEEDRVYARLGDVALEDVAWHVTLTDPRRSRITRHGRIRRTPFLIIGHFDDETVTDRTKFALARLLEGGAG